MNEVRAYYESRNEAQRLSMGVGQLEFARTQELILRYLAGPPAVVFDIGGGAGPYSFWLARQGYEVHLIDLVPLHIAQTRKAAQAQASHSIASLTVGDARAIARRDESVDGVLMLGPLYHLTERTDRVKALREASRILCEGGLVFAASISRFASVLDGLWSGYLDDPEFARIVERDLAEGQHRNPSGHPRYFTRAYFHRPEELQSELEDAGLEHVAMIAVEGPGALVPDLEAWWDDKARRELLLKTLRWLEQEQSLLGASSHIMAIGRKP